MEGYRKATGYSILILLALACAQSGCSTLQPTSWSLLGSKHPATETTEQGVAQDTFVVELRSANGKQKVAKQPLQENMTLQQAMEKMNGFRRFSRFFIELHRPLPDGGMHRMNVDYATATKKIEPEFDYALRPGDHIVITENPESILDDAMNAVLEPIGLDRMRGPKSSGRELPARYRFEG